MVTRTGFLVRLGLLCLALYISTVQEEIPFARNLRLTDEQLSLYRSDKNKQISRDHKVAYVHIPKAGGSTVERSALFMEKIEETGVYPSAHWTVEELLENATERHLDDGYLTATTIRNPCERFISAFHYLKADERAQQVAEYTARFEIDQFDSVDDYVRHVDETPQMWFRLKKFFHFLPMSHFVMKNDQTFGIDVVMCQEYWQEGVERLYSHLNATVPDNMNNHLRQNANNSFHCIDLQPRTRQSLMREYAMDFCLFGYGHRYFVPGVRRDECIGKQLNRQAFTMRHQYCKLQIELEESNAGTTVRIE